MRLGAPRSGLSYASTGLGLALLATSASALSCPAQQSGSPGQQPAGRLRAVPFDRVELRDRFWSPRLETQRRILVPFALDKTEPAVTYLRATAAHRAGDTPVELPRPHRYVCSDLYKVLEGAAYLLATLRDPTLEARIDAIAETIAAAQGDDGYLYCAHLLGHGGAEHMMGDGPYRFVVHSHELYNVGHLYEAAVAYHRATGKRTLLDVALRNARHVGRAFFEGDPRYNGGEPIRRAPGHQEIELALVKLAAETGDRTLLDTARRFLEVRGVTYVPKGRGVMSPRYAQQHAPVAAQREPAGHAVRAAYLYTAMADVDAAYGTEDYNAALDAIWRDLVDTRMHLTGGLGATHGIEGFGAPYDLPNADTYNETCAAVGNVLWNLRMFRLHRDARYLDVAEVALFNGVLAGVALTGDRFFYVNPLAADGEKAFNHGRPERSPWFGTACCPTNLARLLPQVPGMLYAHDGERNLYVTLYAGSETEIELADATVGLRQRTDYPLDGRIECTVSPNEAVRFALRLRIPTWNGDRSFLPGALYRRDAPRAGGFRITVDGDEIADPQVERGFLVLDRTWLGTTRVVLELAMPVQAERADERVEADRGRVAFTRGPLVLCAEEIDHGIGSDRLFVPEVMAAVSRARSETFTLGLADGSTPAHRSVAVRLPAASLASGAETPQTRTLQLVPYYLWNNRGIGSMTVWLPTDAESLPKPGDGLDQVGVVAVRASHTWRGDDVKAIADGRLPKTSNDASLPRWTSWPQRGTSQTLEWDLDRPRSLQSFGLWFYDDGGGVRLPAGWSLETRTDGSWQPFALYVTDDYATEADLFNVVHPAAPVHCDGLRVRLTPDGDACVGVLEARLVFEDD